MPRVILNKRKYKSTDFKKWLIGELKVRKIRQKDVAGWYGITQAAVSQKIDRCDFDFGELVILFDNLQTDEEEIGRLMKV